MKLKYASALMFILLLVGPRGLEAKTKHEVHTVLIEGMKFVPAELQVQAGDTVVWKNEDIVPHTVTDSEKQFNSSTILAGKSWKYVFKKPGSISYFCTFHPVMKATLAVTSDPKSSRHTPK